LKMFKDIHASGHASRQDLIQMLDLVKPAFAIPAHGEQGMMDAYKQLAEEKGIKIKQIVTGQTATFE
jgi:ribonuclease J